MIVKHYSIFDYFSAKNINWDELRDNPKEPSYFVPYDKESYVKMINDLKKPDFEIKNFKKYIEENNINKIISVGAGKGYIEYFLKKEFPSIKIIISDIGNAVKRLRGFQIFDDVVEYNIKSKNFPFSVDEKTLVFLPRIDTEFNQEDFSNMFEEFNKKGVKHIVLTPAELLNFKIIVAELKVIIASFIKRKKLVNCGYARTKSEFIKAWSPFYKIILLM